MKKIMIIIVMICCSFVSVYAKEDITQEFFEVNVHESDHEGIMPGDQFRTSITISNKSHNDIKVRIHHVENNSQDSRLYHLLETSLYSSEHSSLAIFQGKLSDVKTNWYTISKNDVIRLDLNMKFPKESNNDYQGAKLDARILFECIVDDNEIYNDGKGNIIVDTFDVSEIELYVLLFFISLLLIKMMKLRNCMGAINEKDKR